MPLLYLIGGSVIFTLLDLEPADPTTHRVLWEKLTELVVIISLLGAGLRIDTPMHQRAWWGPWRRLITMPLTIVTVAWLGWQLVGLSVASALLLGAVIAPTDPVMASYVQVGPPGEEAEHPVRFTLTAEAGLNDGLAFPFTRPW